MHILLTFFVKLRYNKWQMIAFDKNSYDHELEADQMSVLFCNHIQFTTKQMTRVHSLSKAVMFILSDLINIIIN